MKIALLGPLDHFGGGPRVILELYKIFKENHQVDIITDFYKKENTYSEFEKFPIKILDYKFRNVPFLRRFTVIMSWIDLDLSDYDFAISTHSYSRLSAIKNRNVFIYIFDVRTVVHSPRWSSYPGLVKMIDYVLNFPLKIMEKTAIKKSLCNLTISNYSSEKIQEYYNVSAEVIPIGIHTFKFFHAPSQNFCLYVGRLSPEKRVELIIQAWNYVDGNLKLYIIGKGMSRYVNYLKSLRSKNIQFIGSLEENKLQEMYSKCLCMICPSVGEGEGLVVLEAMASEKPVIVAKDGGGLVEIVRDNIDGFVIDPKPEAIAEKVNFLNKNRKIAEKMGKDGSQRAKEFDWNIIAEKLLSLAQGKIENK